MDDVPASDLLGLRILNTENVEEELLGISLLRRNQLKPDVERVYWENDSEQC